MTRGPALPWIRGPRDLLPSFVFAPETPPDTSARLHAMADDLVNPAPLEGRYFRESKVATVLGALTAGGWLCLLLGWDSPLGLLGILLGPTLTLGAVISMLSARRLGIRRDQLHSFRAQMISPYEDFDDSAQMTLYTAVLAIDRVTASRAAREGRLPGWNELLGEQLWRIARGLKALSEARAMLGRNADALPEQAAAARAAEQSITHAVRQIVEYADSVDRVDRSLDVLDTVIQRDAIDDRLREALAVTSTTFLTTSLADGARQAQAEVDAALRAVRELGETFGGR